MSLPQNLNFLKIEGRRRAITGYLKGRIEAVVSQANSNIIEKSPMYRFFKLPPVDLVTFSNQIKKSADGKEVKRDNILMSNLPRIDGREPMRDTVMQTQTNDVPIFMKDPEHSFDRVMSFGHDFKVTKDYPASHCGHRFLPGDGPLVEEHLRRRLHHFLHGASLRKDQGLLPDQKLL